MVVVVVAAADAEEVVVAAVEADVADAGSQQRDRLLHLSKSYNSLFDNRCRIARSGFNPATASATR
jgi:hypothetical protein